MKMAWNVMNKTIYLLTLTLVTVLFIGCSKYNKNIPIKKIEKNEKIGIYVNVGNLFEYGRDDGNLFNSDFFKYTSIKNFDVDSYIGKVIVNKLNEKGYRNVRILPLTEKMIISKSQKNMFFIDQDIEKESKNFDILIFVENFIFSRGRNFIFVDFNEKTGNETRQNYINTNLSLMEDKNGNLFCQSFLYFKKISDVKIVDDKKTLFSFYRNRLIEKRTISKELVDKKILGSQKNINILLPVYKEMINLSIDKYLNIHLEKE